MSAEIVSLNERRPHLSGIFKCGACKKEWDGVAPVGTSSFECPFCGSERAYSKHHVSMPEGSLAYTCLSCDGYLFSFNLDGDALCAGCGISHEPWSAS